MSGMAAGDLVTDRAVCGRSGREPVSAEDRISG